MIAAPETIDWSQWLRLPSTLLLGLAAVCLVFVLAQGFALRRHVRARHPFRSMLRAVLLLSFLALTLLAAGAGWSLRGYRLLAEESRVVAIDARILTPGQWQLLLHWPDGSERRVLLYGDAWRIEAVVLKWKLPALLAGMPPVYRLDRLSGRYDDAEQEMHAPRTDIDFRPAGGFDLLALYRRHPHWFPMVDTVHGSGTYLPLVERGHYTVSLMRTGALVARPDEATAERMSEAF